VTTAAPRDRTRRGRGSLLRFWRAEHWCQEEAGKVRHPFEAVVLVFALLMLPAVLIQDSGLHSPWGRVADALGALVWVALALELLLTLAHAHDRRRALCAHWHDVLVLVVVFPGFAPLFASVGAGWLRGWRLARLWVIAGRVLRAERLVTRRRNLPYVAALTALLVVVTGIGVHETDASRFPNVWRGLWFAIVTVTTVGYGDTFPVSAGGRVVAAFLMVVGIGFLGLATAAIAGHFVDQDAEDKHRQATDKQDEILAELRSIHARLDRLDDLSRAAAPPLSAPADS
jgi:voltage-gated potassium channel